MKLSPDLKSNIEKLDVNCDLRQAILLLEEHSIEYSLLGNPILDTYILIYTINLTIYEVHIDKYGAATHMTTI